MEDTDFSTFAEHFADGLQTEKLENLLVLLMEENCAERGCLWLPNRDLVYMGDEVLRLKFPFSRSVIRNVLNRGRGLVSFDPTADHVLAKSGSIAANNVRSCLCSAAYNAEGEVLAIAYFDNQSSEGHFSERDLWFLNHVMEQFPGAVPKA